MPNVEMNQQDQQVAAVVGKKIQAILKGGDRIEGVFDNLGDATSFREYIMIGEWKVREADMVAWRNCA